MKPDPLPPPSDPQFDQLSRCLDEWQEQPELSPSFDQRLRRRIAAQGAPALAGWRRWMPLLGTRLPLPGALATLALVVTVSVFIVWGNNRPAPVAATPSFQTAQMDAVVRDLQTFERDGDLLDNLDFLSAPASTIAPRVKDRRD
ncbi:MAG: hypothetical protein ACRD1L_14225 [Terriglobales bacterium]